MLTFDEMCLWMQDLEELLNIAIEQGLAFPLSVTLTASDGASCRGTFEQRAGMPDHIAISIGRWRPLFPLVVCISDHHDKKFHAMIVEGTLEDEMHAA